MNKEDMIEQMRKYWITLEPTEKEAFFLRVRGNGLPVCAYLPERVLSCA